MSSEADDLRALLATAYPEYATPTPRLVDREKVIAALDLMTEPGIRSVGDIADVILSALSADERAAPRSVDREAAVQAAERAISDIGWKAGIRQKAEAAVDAILAALPDDERAALQARDGGAGS